MGDAEDCSLSPFSIKDIETPAFFFSDSSFDNLKSHLSFSGEEQVQGQNSYTTHCFKL